MRKENKMPWFAFYIHIFTIRVRIFYGVLCHLDFLCSRCSAHIYIYTHIFAICIRYNEAYRQCDTVNLPWQRHRRQPAPHITLHKHISPLRQMQSARKRERERMRAIEHQAVAVAVEASANCHITAHKMCSGTIFGKHSRNSTLSHTHQHHTKCTYFTRVIVIKL